MRTRWNRAVIAASAALLGAAVLGSGSAAAQSTLSDEWKFRAFIYMWGPKITGAATFPGGNTADFRMTFGDILDHLKLAGMGTLEAQKGRWGAFTDVVYMNLGATGTRTRDGTIDGVPLPVGVTVNTGVGMKSWVWTLAGSYRVQSTAESEMDVFAGARMLTIEPTLTYDFSADVGPFVGPGRAGSRTVKETNWDAVVGAKGRVAFGANREWFIPYYADIGTGDSDLTWQGSVGPRLRVRLGRRDRLVPLSRLQLQIEQQGPGPHHQGSVAGCRLALVARVGSRMQREKGAMLTLSATYSSSAALALAVLSSPPPARPKSARSRSRTGR